MPESLWKDLLDAYGIWGLVSGGAIFILYNYGPRLMQMTQRDRQVQHPAEVALEQITGQIAGLTSTVSMMAGQLDDVLESNKRTEGVVNGIHAHAQTIRDTIMGMRG